MEPRARDLCSMKENEFFHKTSLNTDPNKLWISAVALQEKSTVKRVEHDKAALDSPLTLSLALIRCLWMVSSGTVASPISVTLIQAEKQNKKRLPRVRHPWPPRDGIPNEEDESLDSTSHGLLTRGIPAQPGTQPRPSPLPPALGPHELRGKAARTQTCTRALGLRSDTGRQGR